MRPTLAEQLRGLNHVLQNVVAPDVQSDYVRETLLGVVRAMDMLTRQASSVGPFLAWDNARTSALLQSIAERVPLAGELDGDTPINTGDLAALDTENERLRGLLSTALPVLAGDRGYDDLHQAVVAHLRERIGRYPYASTGSLPSR